MVAIYDIGRERTQDRLVNLEPLQVYELKTELFSQGAGDRLFRDQSVAYTDFTEAVRDGFTLIKDILQLVPGDVSIFEQNLTKLFSMLMRHDFLSVPGTGSG
jgi:hypothetical protein